MKIIYYHCLCGRKWKNIIIGEFYSPGICVCGSDYIKILSQEEHRIFILNELGI